MTDIIWQKIDSDQKVKNRNKKIETNTNIR